MTHRIVGTQQQVTAALAELHRAGRLATMTFPQPMEDRSGRYVCRVELVDEHPRAVRPAPWWRRWSRQRWIVTGVAVGLVLGGLVWAVVAVVLWVAAHLALVIGLTVAAGAVIAVAAYQRHCRTCGR
jgi:hypothetical protein